MPYITTQRKIALQEQREEPANPGELNYLITYLIVDYYKMRESYQGINDVIGALECAKLEFTRRVVIPYEDAKIKTNGDVY
jgi:hypothetical protein